MSNGLIRKQLEVAGKEEEEKEEEERREKGKEKEKEKEQKRSIEKGSTEEETVKEERACHCRIVVASPHPVVVAIIAVAINGGVAINVVVLGWTAWRWASRQWTWTTSGALAATSATRRVLWMQGTRART